MKEFTHFLKFFIKLKGKGLFSLVLLMLFAGLFEVVGVTMFIPLLEGNSPSSKIGQFIVKGFDYFGLTYSFTKVLIFMVVLLFLKGIFLILKQSYVGKIVSQILVDLRCKTVQKLFNVNYLYFLKKDIGYINNAVVIEFQKIAFAFRTFTEVLTALVFTALYTFIPLILMPFTILAVCVLSFPAVLLARKINIITKDYSVQTSQHSAKLQKFLFQTLQHFKYLKATYSQEKLLEKVFSESKTLGRLHWMQVFLQAITVNAFTPFAILIIAVLLFIQVEILQQPVMEMVISLFFLYRAIERILNLQQNYRKFLASVGSIRAYETLDAELNQNIISEQKGKRQPDFSGTIRFENVSFSYEAGKPVLKNINLSIEPKTTVAFVGRSGSGKSTLATLLTGIIETTTGNLYLTEESFHSINLFQLQRNIGYVTQEGVIFNDSIRNNIALWDPAISEKDIMIAAEKSHIHDFISQLSEKYQTPLGDNGINISGGQRQRIGIARELLKKAKLLIFDEATSSLDSHAEYEIQKNIDEFKGQKTIVLIAHRIATVKNADHIYVLKDGQIAEEGTYEELCVKGGEFQSLVDLQALSETS